MKKGLFPRSNKDISVRPFILDGAMGSYLQESGFKPDQDLWFSYLNISDPETVSAVHKVYIDAGADIITANTFRTNPFAATHTDFSSENLVKKALDIAREAVTGSNVLIAGSNPPAEDCYQSYRTLTQSDLERNHAGHISLLAEYGSDFILNETQSHLDEIKFICRYCSENQLNFVVSLYFTPDFKILSGENIEEIISMVSDYGPSAIGFNCINHVLFEMLLDKIELNFPWGFYLNYGLGNTTDSEIKKSLPPGSDGELIRKASAYRPVFIGGCCGSGPGHIRFIKEYVNEIFNG